MNDLLTAALIRLFQTERFYAELILSMDKIISRKLPTAGVCIKDKIQLYVNPDYFVGLTLPQQVSLLKHEAKHILFDHIGRSIVLAPDVYKKHDDVVDKIIGDMKHQIMNVAADCAVNSTQMDIHEDWVHPSKFKLAGGETMEWYLEKLKDNPEAKGLMKYDDHAIWSESEGDAEVLKEKIRAHVNSAASKAKAAGRMSSNDEYLVDQLNYKPKDWKADLKRFVARNLTINLDSSRKKRNRRYGITQPGTIKTEQLTIGVAIDTSGSVPDEALSQFMAEIAQIAKYANVLVVEADAEVKQSYVFDPKKQYKITGRGGTAYQPALDFFSKERELDGVIYFGDMDSADQPIKPKYPVLWAIFGEQDPPAPWGARTRVEIKNKVA